jgi:transposase
MEARQHWMEWLYQVERRELVAMPDDRLEQRRTLMKMLLPTSQTQRQRALVILAADAGFSANQIAEFLAVTRNSVRKYLKDFRGGGHPSLFNRKVRARKTHDANLRGAVFALLHEPPSASDINRTTWKMTDLRRVLAERGYPACANTIRTIIRDAGYRWRAARVVLTSTDPAYRESLVTSKRFWRTCKATSVSFPLMNLGRSRSR